MPWILGRLGAFVLTVDPPAPPIMVRVIREESGTGFDLADVLIRSLGLTAVIAVASVVLGLLLGGAFIWMRILRARKQASLQGSAPSLRVTPES